MTRDRVDTPQVINNAFHALHQHQWNFLHTRKDGNTIIEAVRNGCTLTIQHPDVKATINGQQVPPYVFWRTVENEGKQ